MLKILLQFNRSCLLRARCACCRPAFQSGNRLLRSARSRIPPGTGCPAPKDERILCHVFRDFFKGPAAVSNGVFDLCADLRRCPAGPCHFDRCKMPIGCAGWCALARPVCLAMASHAAQPWIAETTSVMAALHIHGMVELRARGICGPAWPIVRRVAIGTAWMGQDRVNFRPIGQRIAMSAVYPDKRGAGQQDCGKGFHANFTSADRGNVRMRFLVRAKIALASAGAAGGVPISPTPPMCSAFSRTST